MTRTAYRPFTRPTQARAPIRWICTTEVVSCLRCSETWKQGDPALTIACRGCGARAGAPCCRPRGGNERVCYQRDSEAVQRGLLSRCEGLTWDGRHVKPPALASSPMLHGRSILTGAPATAGLL